MTKCCHLNPEEWKHTTGKDGVLRAFCPGCKKFMGRVDATAKQPPQPPKRKPA